MKKLMYLLLALMLVLALCACGEDETTGDTTTGKPSGTTVDSTMGTTQQPTTPEPTNPNPTEPAEHAHDYQEMVITKPTCVDVGMKFLKCKTCGDINYEEIPSTDHKEIIDEAVASTCEKPGLTEGKHCSVCNEVLVKQEVDNALSHDYQQTVIVKASCEENGLIFQKCKNCGDCDYTEIPFNGHTEETDAAVAATCTKAGLTEGKHCSVCGKVFVSQDVVNALSHDYQQTVIVKASCEENGLMFQKCKNCGDSDYTEIPFKGHTAETDAAVAATCTKPGLTEGKHCSVCNKVLIKQEEVAILPHTEVIDAAVAATCTNPGLTEGKHCSSCNTIFIEQQIVRVPHEYANKKCVNCGKKQPSEGLKFERNTDGYTVSGIGTCTDIDLIIPELHNGLPVNAIGNQAFRRLSNLQSVVIPDTVISIGRQAFQLCTGLESIEIPDSVTYIDDFAFNSCSSLTSITISKNITQIGSGVFSSCSNLTSINIPDGVIYLGIRAFATCENITSVYLPGSLTEIANGVFTDSLNLTDFYFGGTYEQWIAIQKGPEWLPATINYTIHCIDGDYKAYE